MVLGECLVDLAPGPSEAAGGRGRPYVALPGGGPANVAVGLARLGVHAAFAGRFAVEGFGPWLREHLAANAVDLSPSVPAEEPATLAVVTLDGAGRATYSFYGPETADWQWRAGELPSPVGAFAAVHTGSLATTFEPSASVLERWLACLHQAGEVAVSFDPNVRPALIADLASYRSRVERLAACAHIVKASEEDIEVVYPGENVEEVAARWLSAGTALVAVTKGRRGATVFHASGASAHQSPPTVEVVDTIGAGDAFSSGLLAYLAQAQALSPGGLAALEDAELEGALAQAVAASALCCTRPGADPPTASELARFCARD
jgi:fructokinase